LRRSVGYGWRGGSIRGRAALVDDPQRLGAANEGKATPERYVVLEFGVEDVLATTYDGEETSRRRWRA
jgi:hypothetical protein